jgi:spore coat protein U-like protein
MPASAATSPALATFQVKMTIQKSCTISAATSDIQLGVVSGVDASSAVGTTGTNGFGVTCSKGTAYNIALQSTNNASTAGVGTLKGTGSNNDTLTYQLSSVSYTGSAWGNAGVSSTVPGNGVSGTGTGTGASVTIPVFAKVTAATPTAVTPDSYADQVTINVYF